MKGIINRFKRLGHNTRWLILTEPGWSIPMPWIFYYLPVYMKESNINEAQIGLIYSASLLLQIFLPILGGYAADKWGRKNSFILFDLICNLGLLGTLIIAQNIYHFIIALLFSSFYSAVSPAWECLLAEGTEPEDRILGYTITGMIYLTGSIMTPIAGYVLTIMGIKRGFAFLSAIAFVTITIKTLILWIKLKEPAITEKLDKGTVELGGFIKAMKEIIGYKPLAILFMYHIISSIIFASLPNFLSLYLKDSRGLELNIEETSLVPSLSSIVTLIIFFLISFKLEKVPYNNLLLSSASAEVFSGLLFLASPKRCVEIIAVASLIRGIRGIDFSIVKTYITNLIDKVNPKSRAKIISLTYSLPQILSLPAPALMGLIYTLNPRYIWIASITMATIQIITIIKLKTSSKA